MGHITIKLLSFFLNIFICVYVSTFMCVCSASLVFALDILRCLKVGSCLERLRSSCECNIMGCRDVRNFRSFLSSVQSCCPSTVNHLQLSLPQFVSLEVLTCLKVRLRFSCLQTQYSPRDMVSANGLHFHY